ncbi:MAG: amidase family protein [Rhodococcus sp. (in: high G+C Gram-positive bacteria)]|uniref:amidase family protein n=1 Tax=Rhodococcus sp. TaxID=1831 RepID=UPI003BB6D1CD
MTRTLRQWLGTAVPERIELLGDSRQAALEATRSHNTFISVADNPVPADTGGELAGVPFGVKDNIDVAGTPTTAGSPMLAQHIPATDAAVVSALREAGGVVLGKTNLHELAFGVTTNNKTYGAVRNPLDPNRSAGGSSGGSAAAVAMGTVPFSLGTDTGGSVTIPSAFCGVAGFRPTTGRYPGDGVVNLSTTRDTIGIHARTVEDIVFVDHVITRTETPAAPALSEMVLGVVASRYHDMDPVVAQACTAALSALEQRGVTLVDVSLPDDMLLAAGPGIELVFYETERLVPARVFDASGRRLPTDIGDLVDRIASPDVRATVEGIAARRIAPSAYERARRCRWQLRRVYEQAFTASGAHALIFPTVHTLPPFLGEDDTFEVNGRPQPVFSTVTRNTAPGTVAGVPMLSVPVGTTPDALAVGLCIEGRFFADDHLLACGQRIAEVVSPSARRCVVPESELL